MRSAIAWVALLLSALAAVAAVRLLYHLAAFAFFGMESNGDQNFATFFLLMTAGAVGGCLWFVVCDARDERGGR